MFEITATEKPKWCDLRRKLSNAGLERHNGSCCVVERVRDKIPEQNLADWFVAPDS